MILVDTSIWIDHLRSGDTRLADLLDRSQVLVHPFVTGELACGNQLMGLGVGYIDIHLLAATALAENARLWTGDKRLEKVASKMKLAFDE
jgi:predicted nucleic acid-binding protein